MASPIVMDLFSRYMVGLFDEAKVIGVSTGFQAFFGRPENGSETIFSPDANAIDIDIIRGDERIAALVQRGTYSSSLGSANKSRRDGKFTEISRKFPLIKEQGHITGEQILNRVPGENPYMRMDRISRMRYHALREHMASFRAIIRTQEFLASQSILTGKMPAILNTTNANLIYDFCRAASHNITVGTDWSAGPAGGTSAPIMGDIEGGCAKVRADGKVFPDMMVCGATAINNMVNDPMFQKMADNRRFEFIQFGGAPGTSAGVGDDMFRKAGYGAKYDRFIAGGMIPRGILRTPEGYELVIFTYIEVYTDPVTGNPTKYMPDNLVVIASSSARCDRYFGPPEGLPMIPLREQLYRELFGFDPAQPPAPPNVKSDTNVILPQSVFCDCYVSDDWERVTVRSQVAPIYATTMTDAFVTLNTQP